MSNQRFSLIDEIAYWILPIALIIGVIWLNLSGEDFSILSLSLAIIILLWTASLLLSRYTQVLRPYQKYLRQFEPYKVAQICLLASIFSLFKGFRGGIETYIPMLGYILILIFVIVWGYLRRR